MGRSLLIVNGGYLGNDPPQKSRKVKPLLSTGFGGKKKEDEQSNQSEDKSKRKLLFPTGYGTKNN